jgi:hypothetical protein
MSFEFKSIGIEHPTKLRDLWEHKDLSVAGGSYTADVPTHGVAFLRISK